METGGHFTKDRPPLGTGGCSLLAPKKDLLSASSSPAAGSTAPPTPPPPILELFLENKMSQTAKLFGTIGHVSQILHR